jgi:hypothetical protein
MTEVIPIIGYVLACLCVAAVAFKMAAKGMEIDR